MARNHESKTRTRVTVVLAILILIPSLYGFGSKFIEFIVTFREARDGAFAVTPIVNYLLASFGFLLLLFWGIVNGMFHDIEGPKYTMLEQDEMIDKALGKKSRPLG